jgi:hypothetical protein
MARRLGDEPNELRVRDNLSGSEIVLYYRMPTTEENIRYTNALVRREGNKLVSRQGETRQKYGAAILVGIRDGDFERKIGEKYVPISSTHGSEGYDPEWKAHVKKHASDLVELLAVHVFERPAEALEGEKAENEEDQGESPEKN